MNAGLRSKSVFPVSLLVLLALLAAALASITAYNSWSPLQIQNDGVQYLSTAKNIVNGHGVATDTLAFGPHFQGKIPGPQTMWPPGYPALIALLASVTSDFERAALLVNIVAHFVGALLLGLLLLRCGLPGVWALIGASVFYLTFFQWKFIGGLLSEPVFSASILASLCLLPNVKSSGNTRYLLCGILLAVVLLVRHSAVIYIAGVGIGVFILLCRQVAIRAESVKGLIVKCMLLGGPGVLLFAGLMIRVRLTTSSAIAVHGTHAPEDLYFFLSTVFSELGWFLGFYGYGDGIPVIIGKVMTIVFIALLVFWCMLSLGRSRTNRKFIADTTTGAAQSNLFYQEKYRNFRTVLFMVVTIHTVLFFVYFGYCMMTEIPLKFSRRYFFQIHSGLLTMFLAIIYAGWQSRPVSAESMSIGQPPAQSRINMSLALLVLVFFVTAQIHSSASVSLKQQRNGDILRMLELSLDSTIVAGNNSVNTVRKLVDACFKTSSKDPANRNRVQREQGVIWSGQGQMLHQHLRVPTIALANRYRETEMDFDSFSNDIETYNIRMLVMMPYWALENARKIPGIVEWATAENMPVLEVSGYAADLTHKTYVVFVDESCAP